MKALHSLIARCLLAVFLFALLSLRLGAQTITPRTDAQKDADVKWFLQNDDDLIKLKQQLGAKEITNVEYAKRLQELTTSRKEVLARYDRNGQRDIIGIYNAAKKDLQQAAYAAKQKADAEARAKAIADRDAARQAAADAAKAKVESAQEQARLAAVAKAEAAAAEAKTVEDDAQAYTKIVLQHDALFFKEKMQKITPAEQSQASGFAVQGAAIKQKYAQGGPLAARNAEFETRLKQLSQEQVVPAAKGWMADAFPDPAKVSKDYSDEADRAAALVFLRRLLTDKVAQPHPTTVSKKLSDYLQALEKIDPPSSSDHYKKSKKYSARAEEPQFRAEVVKKYLPVFAPEFQFVAQQEKVVAKQKAVSKRLGAGVTLLALALLAVPLVFGLTGGIFSRPKPLTAEQTSDPLQLPPALRVIKVLGKEYGVTMESGLIYDKENWTETSVSTTTSGGGNYNQPVHTTTHVSSTVYHRYWIRTQEGKETWKKFSDDQFPASVGQVISAIAWNTVVIIAYNHNSGHFAGGSLWTKEPHRLPGKKLWFISMGIWLVGYFILNAIFGGSGTNEIPHQNDLLWGGALMTAIFSAIYIGILKIVFQMIRNSQFKKNYTPAFRKLMEERTPELLKRFSGSPAVSAK